MRFKVLALLTLALDERQAMRRIYRPMPTGMLELNEWPSQSDLDCLLFFRLVRLRHLGLNCHLLFQRMRDLDRLYPHLSFLGSGLNRLSRLIPTILFALPARLEELAEFESWEWVSFGIEDHVCERKNVVVREQEEEVLQSLGLGENVSERALAKKYPPSRNVPSRNSPYCRGS